MLLHHAVTLSVLISTSNALIIEPLLRSSTRKRVEHHPWRLPEHFRVFGQAGRKPHPQDGGLGEGRSGGRWRIEAVAWRA